METCPICQNSNKVHRSHSHGFLEETLFRFIRLKAYHCSRCRHRFRRFAFRRSLNGQEEVRSNPEYSGFLATHDSEDFQEILKRIREKEELLTLEDRDQDRHDYKTSRKLQSVNNVRPSRGNFDPKVIVQNE
jgi:hypothetical protein